MQSEQFTHQYWMRTALSIAREVQNEVPVCALIIKGNKLLAQGINLTETSYDVSAHAEIVAIREASKILKNWRLNDCTVYVTLEPCPMCAGAIINSRVSKLVFGAYDVRFGACGTVINLINDIDKKDHIEVIGGILELEARSLIKDFFTRKRSMCFELRT